MKPLCLISFLAVGCSASPPVVNCSAEVRRGLTVLGWIDPTEAKSLDRIKAACVELDPGSAAGAKVILWTDKTKIPYENWPMTDEQIDAAVANYSRNDSSGSRFVDVRGKRHEF